MLSLIVAVADNGVIGTDNALPWRLPADLKRFKALTLGKPIIMGRKTFESLGRVLPGRPHVIITRDTTRQFPEGCHATASLEEAVRIAEQLAGDDGESMIIGGGEIYQQALPLAECVHLTRVHVSPSGDTWFPELSPQEWTESDRLECPGDPDCTFITYRRVCASSIERNA